MEKIIVGSIYFDGNVNHIIYRAYLFILTNGIVRLQDIIMIQNFILERKNAYK